ncbi:hypothetical protein OX88_27575, partial [Pseudomonas coronafaciens pv. porri]
CSASLDHYKHMSHDGNVASCLGKNKKINKIIVSELPFTMPVMAYQGCKIFSRIEVAHELQLPVGLESHIGRNAGSLRAGEVAQTGWPKRCR